MKIKMNTIFNQKGSALIMVMVGLGILSVSIVAINSMNSQMDSAVESEFEREGGHFFSDMIRSNFSEPAICSALLLNGAFSLPGQKLIPNQAKQGGAGEKLKLDIGLVNAAGVSFVVQDNVDVDPLRLHVNEFRFFCDDLACTCVESSPNVCVDFDSVTAGIQPRVKGEVVLDIQGTGAQATAPIHGKSIPLFLQLDSLPNKKVTACLSSDSPATVCSRLGGNWVGNKCKMPLPDFTCPAGTLVSTDNNGDGLPDCKTFYLGCGSNEYLTGIAGGQPQCQTMGYTWLESPWGNCVENPPGTWTQNRSVACAGAGDGSGFADALCLNWHAPKLKPPTQKACVGCSSQMVAWGACSALAPSVLLGNNTGVLASTNANAGTASFTCNAGNFVLDAGSTCAAAASCPAQAVSWTEGGNTCDGFLNLIPDGAFDVATDVGAPTTGSANYFCNAGALVLQAGATCTLVPDPNDCPAQAVSWTVGANVCNGAIGPTVDAANSPATDMLAPTQGNASFHCAAGVITENGGSTCSQSCPAQPVQWIVGGNVCDGAIGPTLDAASSPSVDIGAPTTGNASFLCTGGVISENGGSTCNLAPSRDCQPQAVSWMVNGNVCDSNSLAVVADTNFTGALSDVGAPTTGSANFLCDNTNLVVQPGSSCALAAPDCPPQTVNWIVGANLCSVDVPLTLSGALVPANDVTALSTGVANFLCDASGNLVEQAGSTCVAPKIDWMCPLIGLPCATTPLDTGEILLEGKVSNTVDECGCPNGWDYTYQCKNGVLIKYTMPCWGFNCPQSSMCR